MCGIAGYADFSFKTNRNYLRPMIGEIIYRGPDSSGEYYNKAKNVALGVRRLSIIDLASGDQPIKNEDNSVVVVYNGEIYNYQELRRRLIKKGHKFKTKSDTEVLVHLYEEYGQEMSKYLNGMFVFAIWDEKNEKLLISRDRAGIKPLYYYKSGKTLIFGSEVKTILKHPLYKRQIDNEGLSLYFYLGFTIGERTVYKGISKLLPGHTLSFSRAGFKVKKYFELSSNKNVDGQLLDDILHNSVKMQLQADVPVGVFLSGGLDSSLIAYYISKIKKLKSFSIGFSDPRYDESEYAHYVAKKLGTKHYCEEFKSSDVVSIFNKIISKLDEPFADASLLPTYKVSELARKHVKVVLSGDGGDELFGGYPTYQAGIIADYLKFLPSSFINKASDLLDLIPDFLLNALPVSFKDYSKKELAKIVLAGIQKENPERHLYWTRTFFFGDKGLFNKPNLKFLSKIIPDLDNVSGAARKSQFVDFYTYLRDDFFFKVDRASMYNSLEVRVPFLDNNVIDFAYSTKKTHVNLLQTKILLREPLKEILPEIAKRPKKGFGIPLEKWLRDDLKDFGYSMITNKKLYNYLDKKKVLGIWNDHQKMKRNNSGTIWMLIMLSGWLNNYGRDLNR